jgi:hypothetical protein
METHEE